MRNVFGAMALMLRDCTAVVPGASGVRQVVDIARSMTGQFIQTKVYKDPVEGAMRHGFIGAVPFRHQCLDMPDSPRNVTDFSYIPGSRTFIVGQGGDTPGLGLHPLAEERANLDRMANGQLLFAQLVYPLLKPNYGFIDEDGHNAPSDKSAARLELKYILWANFFGPAYVEKYGRDFLLNAPGWKKEELGDGGIRYIVTESYYDWWTKPPKEVLEYFRVQVPGVKLYRAKSSDF